MRFIMLIATIFAFIWTIYFSNICPVKSMSPFWDQGYFSCIEIYWRKKKNCQQNLSKFDNKKNVLNHSLGIPLLHANFTSRYFSSRFFASHFFTSRLDIQKRKRRYVLNKVLKTDVHKNIFEKIKSLKNVWKWPNRCFEGKCRRFRILPNV